MEKAVIYQVFTRLFGNRNTARVRNGSLEENGTGKFSDLDDRTLRRIHDLGVTHVWYTGVIRHATATDYSALGIPRQSPSVVKGKAGSPYAICDYYDVDPDLASDAAGRMREWEDLVARTHKAGMKVVMDFVPNHVARQYKSVACPSGVEDPGASDNADMHFSPRNDFYYCPGQAFVSPCPGDYEEYPAKATGNDCFSPRPGVNDWYETVKLNYGVDYNDWSGTPSEHFSPVPPLWDKMTDILLFWASKKADGFRCDMAEMVPAAFWRYASARLKKAYPGTVLIGEVYNPAQYRNYISAGFDWLYDKVGMYDTLRDVVAGRQSTAAITARWRETDDIRGNMLYFLENHDEQRIASDFFAGKAEKAVPAFMVCALLYSNPVMLYAGQEFGEKGMDEEGFSGRDGRTTIFDYWCVDSLRRGYFDRRSLTKEERRLENVYGKILDIALHRKEISSGTSFDLMYANQGLCPECYAFLRGNDMLVAVNFGDEETERDIVIPEHAFVHSGIEKGRKKAADLLSGAESDIDLNPDAAVKVRIPARGGVALKW